jgi:UDP-GlcNAc:undecaprenyl-phosphate GlcNAc-1-phosphate transferase
MKSLWALFLLSLGLSSFLVPLGRWVFIRLGKLDQPDNRKMHRIPVPRSGGLSLISSYLIAVGLILLLPAGGNVVFERYGSFLARLLPAIAVVFLTGFFDDLLNLSPVYKLLGQFVAASCAYWAGVRLVQVPEGGEVVGFAITAFWLILCSNAFNLIDGTDGLAGTLGVVSCLGIIVVALSLDYYSLALVFTPLLGAVLPFLRANWPPASLFLGDTGSLSLGFLIGCGGAALARRFPNGEGFAAALLIMTLPLMETALSSLRRALRGHPIFTPDNFHIHHQLKRQGHDDASVLLRLGLLSLVGTSIAVVQIWTGPLVRFCLLAGFLGYLGFRVSSLRYPEFNVLWEAVLGGRIRSWFRHQILLRSLEEELAKTKNPDRVIALLESAVKDLGLLDLNVRLHEHRMIHATSGPTQGTYAVRIDLPQRNWVNYRVPVKLKRTENPAADFAAVILRALNERKLQQLQAPDVVASPRPEATLV